MNREDDLKTEVELQLYSLVTSPLIGKLHPVLRRLAFGWNYNEPVERMDFLDFIVALNNKLSHDYRKIFIIENKHIYMRCSAFNFTGDIQEPKWLLVLFN